MKSVTEFQKEHPNIFLGVELTPIEKPEYDYIQKHGTRDGYIPPVTDKPYEIELAMTKEQLIKMGVRYAVGGAHWRVDIPNAKSLAPDKDALILVYCRSGRRSKNAASQLVELGYSNVKEFGGIIDWPYEITKE